MLIRYPKGGFTYVFPLRESHHDTAIALLTTVQKLWIEHGEDFSIVPEVFPLIRSICLMTPTAPGLDWDFEQLTSSNEILKEFFFKSDCHYVKMHEFEPKSNELPDKGEFKISPPESGNPKADRIASYLHNTEWPPSEVEKLLGWLSREELHNVVWSMTELAIPDRRIEIEKQKIVEEWGIDLEEISQMIAFDMYDDNDGATIVTPSRIEQ